MSKQSKRHMGLEVQGDLVTSNSLMFRNVLINGNFDIWQRGTSGTDPNQSEGGYVSADRWRAFGVENAVGYAKCTLTRSGDVPAGSRYSAKISAVTAGTDWLGILQYIEAANIAHLAGQTVTLSLKLKKFAQYNNASPIKIDIFYLDTLDTAATNAFTATGMTVIQQNNHTISGSDWESVSFTTTLPTNAVQGICVRISYSRENMGAGEVFGVAQVQLEAGSSASAFEHRPIGTELALCQRYYEKSYNLDVPPGTNVSAGANVCSITSSVSSLSRLFFDVRYAVPKRTTAVMGSSVNPIKIYSEDGTVNAVSQYNSSTKLTVNSVVNSSFNSLGNFMNMSTNATSGQAYFFHWTADAEL